MKKIILLATGGTIACVPGADGLAPGVTAAELRAHLLPGAVYRVVLLNEEMRPVREIWEEELAGSIGDPALSFDKEEGEGYNQKYQQRMTQEG